MRQFLISIFFLFAGVSALACSASRVAAWETAVNSRPLNAEATAESIAQAHNVTIQPRFTSGNCQTINILDTDGSELGSIPVTYQPSIDYPELDRRIQHLLQTDRSTLRRLSGALDAYVQDTINIDETFGVSTESRYNLPELSGGGVSMELQAWTCSEDGGNYSNGNKLQTANGQESRVTLNHIAYRPDVSTYEDHRIYSEGELQRQLFSNPTTLQTLFNHNQSNMAAVNKHVPRIGPSGQTSRSPCRQSVLHASNFVENVPAEAWTQISPTTTVGTAEGTEL